MTPTMRDRALAVARLGLRVFPLKAMGKTPAVKRFYDVATSDPAAVAKMWTGADGESLNWNIGISTDNLLVIDVDNKHGKNGDATLAKLATEHGLDLNTPTSLTPTGGRHLFYRLPPGEYVITNSVNKLGPGIDIRGYHGFVVAPGSVVPAGEYRWSKHA